MRRSPLVGRERELGRLATALESASGGDARVVLIAAPIGRGATRLLEELAERGSRGADTRPSREPPTRQFARPSGAPSRKSTTRAWATSSAPPPSISVASCPISAGAPRRAAPGP